MASSRKDKCETAYYHVGATIDNRYELIDFIGAGGMACVYRAKEQGAPLEFALKFLKAQYHNMPYLVEFFEDEASSMRDLAHPNIVRFYRFVNRENYSYIVMDFVDGFSLSEVIKLSQEQKKHMPLDEVIRIMTQIARALDAIHREGFIHRDVKPSNILIEGKSGQAFLTDLGITSTSNTLLEGAGTMAYMSPEQAETWVADVRSDVYSYGILLFEMLTMTRPYRLTKGLRGAEAEADLLRKHKEAPIPNVTDYRQDLPKAINRIIAKGIAKNPDDRYQSVIDFARDVHKVLRPKLTSGLQNFERIQHHQIAAPDTVERPQRRTSASFLIGVGVAAIIFAALIITASLYFNGASTPTAAIATVTPTEEPTATHTSVPTSTPTPNPLEGAADFPFLTGANAFSASINGEGLSLSAAEDTPLRYFRVGMVDGFRVEMVIDDLTDVNRYGVAYRMQDAENYHYFALNPATLEWQIAEVISGIETVRQIGQLEAEISRLVATGNEDFFEIRADEFVISYVSPLFETGSLALYLDGGEITLETLEISLIGEDALTAADASPTPGDGIGDPLRFLRADVNALLDANDPSVNGVDCPVYIAVYETLGRHLENDNAEVRDIAQNTIDIGASIYDTCRTESPDTPFSFSQDVQKYLDWESNLTAIQEQLQ